MVLQSGARDDVSGPSAPDFTAGAIRTQRVSASLASSSCGRLAEKLGTGCPNDHRVGQGVALIAKERHIERLAVIPVMTLQPAMPAAPGTNFRPCDQAELLTQRRGVSRRSRANPPRLQAVQADLQMTFKAGPQGTMTAASALPHG